MSRVGRDLDFSRSGRPRRGRGLCRVLAAAVCIAVLGVLAARVWGLGLPRRLADRLCDARVAALQRQNAALRTALAGTAGLAEENAALRTLLDCVPEPAVSWQPLWVTARWPGGFSLESGGRAGAAVVDRSGRFAGILAESGRVDPAGQGSGAVACRVGTALGVLARRGTALLVTDLPAGTVCEVGAPVVTADGGWWVGCAAAAPEAEPGSLAMTLTLADTADEGDCLYFAGA